MWETCFIEQGVHSKVIDLEKPGQKLKEVLNRTRTTTVFKPKNMNIQCLLTTSRTNVVRIYKMINVCRTMYADRPVRRISIWIWDC